MSESVSRSNLFRYAFLATPLAFAGLPIYMLAPDFYSVHLSVSLATLGIGLLFLRLFDAFIDPLLGAFIDRFIAHSKMVSVCSCVTLGVGFFMLFSPPSGLGVYAVFWFFASIFVVTLAFSALTILYGAVGAIWASEKSAQTMITSYREAMTLVGFILSISIPFVLMEVTTATRAFLILTGLFLCLLIPAFIRYLPVQTAVINKPSSPDQSIQSESQRESIGRPNSSIAFLYLSYAISSLGTALPAVLVIFFVRDYLGSQVLVGLALLLYFFFGALSMPVWHRLAGQVGKHRAWQISMMLSILSFTWVFLLAPGDFGLYVVICLLSGLALGGEMAIPPSILAEYIDGGASSQSAAKKYSGLTMISKLSLAVCAGLSLPLLSYVGFVAGDENSENSLSVLVFLYGALPGILRLIALLITQYWIQVEKMRKKHGQK